MSKTGALLINLGTPDHPTPEAVGTYLKEFLMDPDVVDIPTPLRWILVNVMIVPKRKFESAEAYQKVWTDRGSPLLSITRSLTNKVDQLVDSEIQVRFAMRYGNPSIHSTLSELKGLGTDRLIVIPLYPQYAKASTRSSLSKVNKELEALDWNPEMIEVEHFYRAPQFIDPVVNSIREAKATSNWEHLLFSYHGVPENHVTEFDSTGSSCLAQQDCCLDSKSFNQHCYRHHCFMTTQSVVEKLGLSQESYSVSFQSRLGRRPWIKPFTDQVISDLYAKGIKNLAVVCPSFVADCLETLEEIQIRLKEDWIKLGGTDFTLIPCINDRDDWAKGVASWIHSEN